MRTRLPVWLAAAGFVFASMSFASTEGIGFSVSSDPNQASVRISVLDEATSAPLSGAKIAIGDAIDGSTQELVTDAEGRVSLPAPAPKYLTVKKTGFRTVTVVGATANQIQFLLREIPLNPRTVIASGVMPTWDRDEIKGGNVKAGLIYRALSPADLLRFDLDTLVSPIKDTIDVFGQREIPSNISLPDQKVTVGIVGVHLDKPLYRLPLEQGEAVKLAGLQLEIPAKDLIGGVDLKLFNKAKFKHVGVTGEVTANNDFTQDVDASAELTESHQVVASRPPFTADVIVTAVTDVTGDRGTLLLSDVKLAVDSAKPTVVNPVTLQAPSSFGAQKHVVTLAINQQTEELSGIVTLNAGKIVKPGDFLSMRSLRRATRSTDSIQLKAPAQGISVALFENQGQTQWAVYALPSAGTVSIPTRPTGASSASIMQLDFGSSFDEHALDGKTQLRSLNRFTRKAVTLP